MSHVGILTYTLLSGGAEKQIALLANSLVQSNYIYIYVFYGDRIDKRITDLLLEKDEIKIVTLQGNVFNKYRELSEGLKRNKIDCFFTFLSFPNLFGGFVASRLKIPIIAGGIRNAHLPLSKWIIESIVNNFFSTHTIFNNYAGARKSKSFLLDQSKIVVIHNRLEDEISSPKTKVSNQTKVIVTASRFVEEKDYKTALKSISLLKAEGHSLKYIIIGYGKLESKIRKWIEKFELESVVQMVIRPRNVIQYLSEADIYLSTSLFEGVSNSILEAMNAQLPIVATDVGDNNYLVQNNFNGYIVKCGDFESIASKLKSLILDDNLRHNFGENSLNVLRGAFSKEIFEEKYLELLSNHQKIDKESV